MKEYKSLGITFTKLNNCRTIKRKLCQHATKIIYYILSKSKDNRLSIECKLKQYCYMDFKYMYIAMRKSISLISYKSTF